MKYFDTMWFLLQCTKLWLPIVVVFIIYSFDLGFKQAVNVFFLFRGGKTISAIIYTITIITPLILFVLLTTKTI